MGLRGVKAATAGLQGSTFALSGAQSEAALVAGAVISGSNVELGVASRSWLNTPTWLPICNAGALGGACSHRREQSTDQDSEERVRQSHLQTAHGICRPPRSRVALCAPCNLGRSQPGFYAATCMNSCLLFSS